MANFGCVTLSEEEREKPGISHILKRPRLPSATCPPTSNLRYVCANIIERPCKSRLSLVRIRAGQEPRFRQELFGDNFSLFPQKQFPDPTNIFPVPMHREFFDDLLEYLQL